MAIFYNKITDQKKLQRQYRLTVQTADENGVETNEAIVLESEQHHLTIKFAINRTLFADINSMDIDIYNLAPDTYNKLFYDYFNVNRRTIILEAGYKGQEMSTIFIGDVWNCFTERQGSDIITRIHALVGLKSLQAQTDITLHNITRDKILYKAADDMALDIEIYSGEDTQFSRDVSLSGNSMGIIQQYSDNNAFIDNNVIKVLNDKDAIKGNVVLINDEAGLLGVPKREDAILKVTMIFEPRIVIGQIIEIKSRIMPQFDGQYKVYGLKHEGTISDSIAGTCTTTLEMLVGSQIYGRFDVKNKHQQKLN